MSIASQPYNLPGHIVLDEPQLRFGSSDERDVDTHPLRGLLRFGPYSKNKISAVSNPIRTAMITPSDHTDRLVKQMRELEQSHPPRERKAYLPAYPGFEKVFGVRLMRAGARTSIELPSDLSTRMRDSQTPHVVLGQALTQALFALRNLRDAFDIVVILLKQEWEAGFRGPPGDDFDLHDYVKAYAASEGICVQFLREDKALNYFCRCSVAWRLGIALYTKAGGVPWVLAEVDPGTAFIGIGYALRSDSSPDSRFAICCSQVFDAEGSGLEFVAYEANDVKLFGKNPFLRREQMLKVMARSLTIYQRKHSGDSPRRIVVHKSTKFIEEEIDGYLMRSQVPKTSNSFTYNRAVAGVACQSQLTKRCTATRVDGERRFSSVRMHRCCGPRATYRLSRTEMITSRKAREFQSHCCLSDMQGGADGRPLPRDLSADKDELEQRWPLRSATRDPELCR